MVDAVIKLCESQMFDVAEPVTTAPAGRAQRRREYMERDSIRSDSKLFVGLFVAFLAPAAGILIWAFTSGYLDQLAQGYKRF